MVARREAQVCQKGTPKGGETPKVEKEHQRWRNGVDHLTSS